MRILFSFIAIPFLVVSLFAGVGEASNNKESFDKAINVMKDRIFTQRSTQTGKDGIKITCTLVPSQSVAAVAWEIENPNNKPLTIKSDDIRLYNGSRKFKKISPDQAIEVFFNWGDDSNASNDRQQLREDLRGSPGQESKEDLMREAAFIFGESSEIVIDGITYFNLRLRVLSGVTAEIEVNNEIFKFSFEGGKSPQ